MRADHLTDPLQVHMIAPVAFNDARRLADKLKTGVPVFLDLRAADSALAERLMDFASGLAAALDGSVTQVSDGVLLVAPANVEVSGERPRQDDTWGEARPAGARVTPLRRVMTA